MSEVNVRALYKQILRAAKHYPSSNRESLIEAIREEFRASKNLEGEKLKEKLRLAVFEKRRLEFWAQVVDKKDPRNLKKDSDIVVDL
mmetsp:Transcript_22649/g.90765  ORF Transcript_22649/g.90765 Transcript_22649/m.90765 type:complete len:87 (-) Transcript_22649:1293-1553(-)